MLQYCGAYWAPINCSTLTRVVQGLKEALYTAINQIKPLKGEKKTVKEKTGLPLNRQTEVSQLQERLKGKDKQGHWEKAARTKACVETLNLLAQEVKELRQSTQQ